ETTLCDARQWANAVGEVAVKAVDGQGDGLDLAFAPTFVTAQDALSAGIFAHAEGGGDQLAECRGVQQAEIDALPRQRVNDVRGIAYQRAPVRREAMRGQLVQRKRQALRTQFHGSQHRV